MSTDELDTLRRRFRQLLRDARWTRSRTPRGAPLLIGRLGSGHRVYVWPQADGRLRVGCDELRVADLQDCPRGALVALAAALATDGRPRYARACAILTAAGRF